jgi:threonine/homoserine/homoserine lactone efflux protein
MSSFSEFLLWLSVIFPLVFSAGPGNILCAVCGASNGLKESLPFILGLDLVYTTYALLGGFGLAVIITSYPIFFSFVQIVGVFYIIWLGYKFLRRKNVQGNSTPTKLKFIDGVISQALNVKGIAIVMTMYSQFLDKENLVFEVITLSLSLLVLNLFTHTTWAYGGAWMTKKFASDYAVQLQSKVFGIMLILVAFWLLYNSFYK